MSTEAETAMSLLVKCFASYTGTSGPSTGPSTGSSSGTVKADSICKIDFRFVMNTIVKIDSIRKEDSSDYGFKTKDDKLLKVFDLPTIANSADRSKYEVDIKSKLSLTTDDYDFYFICYFVCCLQFLGIANFYNIASSQFGGTGKVPKELIDELKTFVANNYVNTYATTFSDSPDTTRSYTSTYSIDYGTTDAEFTAKVNETLPLTEDSTYPADSMLYLIDFATIYDALNNSIAVTSGTGAAGHAKVSLSKIPFLLLVLIDGLLQIS